MPRCRAGQLGVTALVEWLARAGRDARSDAPDGSRRLETERRGVAGADRARQQGPAVPDRLSARRLGHLHRRRRAATRCCCTTRRRSPDDCLLDVGGLGGTGRRDRLAGTSGGGGRGPPAAVRRRSPGRSARSSPGGHRHEHGGFRSAPVAVSRSGSVPPTGSVRATGSCQPAARTRSTLDPLAPRPRSDRARAVRTEARRPAACRRTPGWAVRARRSTRPLDVEWRRTSYSGLTAAAHGSTLAAPAVGSEPEVAVEDDEPIGPPAPPHRPGPHGEPGRPGLDRVSPMAAAADGHGVRQAVHAVHEAIDPETRPARALLRSRRRRRCPDLVPPLRAAGACQRDRPGAIQSGPRSPRSRWLTVCYPTMRTPLGPIAGRPHARRHRRSRPAGRARVRAAAGRRRPPGGGPYDSGTSPYLLAAHLADDDPLAAYPALLADPPLREQVAARLPHGSIDAVLRVRATADRGVDRRYLIVDYKTNWLGAFDGAELTLASYAPRPARARR